MKANQYQGGDKVLNNIKQMEAKREERRQQNEEIKQERLQAIQAAKDAGKVCDFDFDQMIANERKNISKPMNHIKADSMAISVCVRKRPIFPKEMTKGEIDAVSVFNPKI